MLALHWLFPSFTESGFLKYDWAIFDNVWETNLLQKEPNCLEIFGLSWKLSLFK